MSVLMPEHRLRDSILGDDWQRGSGGLFLPPSATPSYPTAMDLFAGAGGFSCGLHMAGFHVVAASEWWPVAVETYLCNLGSPSTIVHVGKTAAPDATKKEQKIFAEYGGEAVPAGVLFSVEDRDRRPVGPGAGWIAAKRDHEPEDCPVPTAEQAPTPEERAEWCETYHGSAPPHQLPCEHLWMCDAYDLHGEEILEALEMDFGELDLVVGGPPCQGFSTANASASKEDSRNLLVFEFARVVLELHPRAMAMENVPAIVSATTAEGIPVIDALARVLEDGDMGSYEALRKSILTTAGLGAAVRSKKRRPEKTETDASAEANGSAPLPADREEQLALEMEAVA